jgi:hypothetical protein
MLVGGRWPDSSTRSWSRNRKFEIGFGKAYGGPTASVETPRLRLATAETTFRRRNTVAIIRRKRFVATWYRAAKLFRA